jgi:hypothetical protein
MHHRRVVFRGQQRAVSTTVASRVDLEVARARGRAVAGQQLLAWYRLKSMTSFRRC